MNKWIEHWLGGRFGSSPKEHPADPCETSLAATEPDCGLGEDLTVLMLTDSPIAGSAELEAGIELLKNQVLSAHHGQVHWISCALQDAPAPAELRSNLNTHYLLVLTDPALLATSTLSTALIAALQAAGAVCAIAEDNRFAQGEWAPQYSTLFDLQAYVRQRCALPIHTPASELARAHPKAYMIRLDRWRALPSPTPTDWTSLAAALTDSTVMAPQAYVHSYSDYQSGARAEMLELLPESVRLILDVGGGEGGFAQLFCQQSEGEAVLIEPSAVAAQKARAKGLEVIERNFDALEPTNGRLFDAACFLDVLEHLPDPLAALRHARNFLKPQGFILLSVPNVGYWSVVRDLSMGRFDYLPVGILCCTHLRFFTEHSLRQLLTQAGFSLLEIRRHQPAFRSEIARYVQAMKMLGIQCDEENLATESLHVLARMD